MKMALCMGALVGAQDFAGSEVPQYFRYN